MGIKNKMQFLEKSSVKNLVLECVILEPICQMINTLLQMGHICEAELLKINLQKTVVGKKHIRHTAKLKKQQPGREATQIIRFTYFLEHRAAYISATHLN